MTTWEKNMPQIRKRAPKKDKRKRANFPSLQGRSIIQLNIKIKDQKIKQKNGGYKQLIYVNKNSKYGFYTYEKIFNFTPKKRNSS